MTTDQQAQDRGTSSTGTNLVLLHRLPSYDAVSIFPALKTRFTILDPLVQTDDSSQNLCLSVRVMLCVGPSPVTSETFGKYPSLECVVGSSAGIDHIDLQECRRRGIRVTNAGDAFSDDVADYAVGLLIDVLRRVSSADRFVRAGLWPVKKDFPLGHKVGGKRVGIVGLGSIGMRISQRLVPFGCTIAYNSRKMKPHVPFPYYANVYDLANKSGILIVCCALTNETYHLINKDIMKALGKEGIIINVGRGALVDEKELVEFLMRGEIGGAGLDVYENEPHVPEQLYALDNVVLSPHKAVITPESFAALQEVVLGNLEAFFLNKPLLSQVEVEL